MKGVDKVEASSSDLQIPPEEGINQADDIDKVINSKIWKYITDFMLDMIRALIIPLGIPPLTGIQ